MAMMTKAAILLVTAIAGGTAGYIGSSALLPGEAKAAAMAEVAPVSAGQFTVPVFEGGDVAYVLLTQIYVEVETLEQAQILSKSRPRLRSIILESLFAMEREDRISPQSLTPEAVSAAVKADLEASFEVGPLPAVLIERLLLQETNRARAQRIWATEEG